MACWRARGWPPRVGLASESAEHGSDQRRRRHPRLQAGGGAARARRHGAAAGRGEAWDSAACRRAALACPGARMPHLRAVGCPGAGRERRTRRRGAAGARGAQAAAAAAQGGAAAQGVHDRRPEPHLQCVGAAGGRAGVAGQRMGAATRRRPCAAARRLRLRSRRGRRAAHGSCRTPRPRAPAVGRKSREVFDDVWTQLQRIGNPVRSAQAADRLT